MLDFIEDMLINKARDKILDAYSQFLKAAAVANLILWISENLTGIVLAIPFLLLIGKITIRIWNQIKWFF